MPFYFLIPLPVKPAINYNQWRKLLKENAQNRYVCYKYFLKARKKNKKNYLTRQINVRLFLHEYKCKKISTFMKFKFFNINVKENNK